jgi:hypothetical protein
MRTLLVSVTLLVLGFGSAQADPLDDEIAALIGSIRQSPCTFIRNGSEYDGMQAAEHIQAKYEYYKDEIGSVDDFIARAASKSVLTGRPYEVRCGDKTVPAADWLRAEDEAYRADHPR